MATVTTNLGIPLLSGDMLAARGGINDALTRIDQQAISKKHLASGGHWSIWQKNKAYLVGDVIRTDDCYSWAFLECVTAGTSGGVVPASPYGVNDKVTDGGVVWTLRKISGSGGGVTNHKDLIGKSLPDQHPITAITDLGETLSKIADASYLKKDTYSREEATKLLEDKANKTDLHTHDNKKILDKFSEKDGRPAYDGASIGASETWKVDKDYKANDIVVYNGQLFVCLADHKSVAWTADAAQWQSVGVGNIPDWQANVNYRHWDVVCQGTNVLRCIAPHASAVFASEKNHWEIITGKGATLPEWHSGAFYELGEAVVINDIIYRCTSAHTASTSFSNDMVPGMEKWKAINGAGGAGVLKQVTKLGVTGPYTFDIIINMTTTFNLPPVEILKFVPGPQDQVYTACAFDNSDASKFIIDEQSGELCPWIKFDGLMKPNTSYKKNCSDPVVLADGKYSESDFIDPAEYQSIYSISI